MKEPTRQPIKFTVKKIESLQSEDKRYEVSEINGHGFRLRISPKNHKTFIYRYRLGLSSKVLTYGAYPILSLAEAHKMHAEAVLKVKEGIDPAELKKTKLNSERKAETITTLVSEYITHYAKQNKITWQDDQRFLEKDVIPVWGNRKIKDITHRDVVDLLDGVLDRGGPTRQRLASIITMMFKTAVTRGYLEKSPVNQLASTASKPRERFLDDHEIKVVWEKSMEIGAMPAARYGLRLLLLTLQRRGEFNKALWCNVDFEGRLWKIPRFDTKNKIYNDVYLCDLALDQFKCLKENSVGSPYVMTSLHKGKIKKYNANSFSNISKNYNCFGLPHWTLHDLRRTACSKMLALGALPHVVERILNHKQPPLIEIYHRYDYAKERGEAFKLWGEWLENLVKQ